MTRKISTQSELDAAFALHQAQIGFRRLAEHISHCANETGPAQMCVHLGPSHSFVHIHPDAVQDVCVGMFAVADALREKITKIYGITFEEMEKLHERHEAKIQDALVSGTETPDPYVGG